jgi:hypothetical protein
MPSMVFLLGAGFSRAISDKMPMMSELSEAVKELLKARYIPGADKPISANFEQWLSYLIERPPWLPVVERERNRVAFLEVSGAVHSILSERQKEAVASQPQGAPEWLQRIVPFWEEHHANVITFNYDNLVELAWRVYGDQSNWPLVGGSLYPILMPYVAQRFSGTLGSEDLRQEGLTLFKLHGSLDWRYAGPDGVPGDLVYQMGDVRQPAWDAEGLGFRERAEEMALDLEPMIVPPATVKSAYYNNRTLQAIWSRAADALADADELVMMGFSLPQTDLLVSSMLSTVLPSGIRVTPVNPDPTIIERIQAIFDSGQINDSFTRRGSDPIQEWVDANVPTARA